MLTALYNKPYYAVIFASTLRDDSEGYSEMAIKMAGLAELQPGYLGMDSARSEIGITISYWENLESIKKWKENIDHQEAQEKGRNLWYSNYTLRVCLVEREYDFTTSEMG